MNRSRTARKLVTGSLQLALALGSVALGSHARAASYTLDLTDPSGAPLEHAVVALYPADAPPAALAQDGARPQAVMDQRNHQFAPHVLAVRVGTAVHFPNSDRMRHHVYSFSPAKPFELKLYRGMPAEPVIFDRAGPVVLGCNIHDEMLGYIYVVESGLFATTAADGRAHFAELPAGEYRVAVWHPGLRGENPHALDSLRLAPDEQRAGAQALDAGPSRPAPRELSPLERAFKRGSAP